MKYQNGCWISVNDDLPECVQIDADKVCSHVLCFYRDHERTVHMGYAIKEKAHLVDGDVDLWKWYDQNGTRWEEVTHWMPLPEPPEKVET